MRIIKPFLKLFIISALLVTAFPLQAATPAKDFTLKNRQSENIKLSELRGDVVMINFWASWCGPCRQEMPLLEAIYQEYHELGFTILGVNVDEENSDAKKFLKDVEVNFPILFDPENSTAELYDVDAMPSTIMVDRDGNVRYLHRGYLPGYEKEYEDQVKLLVME